MSLCVWPVLLSITSGSICAVAGVRTPFLEAVHCAPCGCDLVCPSIHLCHLLAVVCPSAVDRGVQASLHGPAFSPSGRTPRSGIAGSPGGPSSAFLRSRHVFCTAATPFYVPPAGHSIELCRQAGYMCGFQSKCPVTDCFRFYLSFL